MDLYLSATARGEMEADGKEGREQNPNKNVKNMTRLRKDQTSNLLTLRRWTGGISV